MPGLSHISNEFANYVRYSEQILYSGAIVERKAQGSSSLDQCELQVDRGDGKGFVVLAVGRILGYVDNEPFSPASVQWTYRAINRTAGNRVGQWSKPVTLTVGG